MFVLVTRCDDICDAITYTDFTCNRRIHGRSYAMSILMALGMKTRRSIQWRVCDGRCNLLTDVLAMLTKIGGVTSKSDIMQQTLQVQLKCHYLLCSSIQSKVLSRSLLKNWIIPEMWNLCIIDVIAMDIRTLIQPSLAGALGWHHAQKNEQWPGDLFFCKGYLWSVGLLPEFQHNFGVTTGDHMSNVCFWMTYP